MRLVDLNVVGKVVLVSASRSASLTVVPAGRLLDVLLVLIVDVNRSRWLNSSGWKGILSSLNESRSVFFVSLVTSLVSIASSRLWLLVVVDVCVLSLGLLLDRLHVRSVSLDCRSKIVPALLN